MTPSRIVPNPQGQVRPVETNSDEETGFGAGYQNGKRLVVNPPTLYKISHVPPRVAHTADASQPRHDSGSVGIASLFQCPSNLTMQYNVAWQTTVPPVAPSLLNTHRSRDQADERQ